MNDISLTISERTTCSESGTGRSGYGFTGEQYTPYNKYIYLRARWYSPSDGRFVSVDPWSGTTQSPQTLNHYTYVTNRPINLIDPSGLKGIQNWDLYKTMTRIYYNIDITDLSNPDDMPEDITVQMRDAILMDQELPRRITQSSLFRVLINFEGNPLTSWWGVVKDVQRYCNPFTQETGFLGETYNTYDWLFSGWMDYWNWRAERRGIIASGERLDPNIVKAMAFQESRLGYDPGEKREGIMQVTELRQEDLRSLGWGPINMTNPEDHAQNIGGGVRWLFANYEAMGAKRYWISGSKEFDPSAVQRYNWGKREGAPGYPYYNQIVYALYKGGYNPRGKTGWKYNSAREMWEHQGYMLWSPIDKARIPQ